MECLVRIPFRFAWSMYQIILFKIQAWILSKILTWCPLQVAFFEMPFCELPFCVMPLCVLPFCVMLFLRVASALRLFACCLFAYCLFACWLLAWCLFLLCLFACWLFACCLLAWCLFLCDTYMIVAFLVFLPFSVIFFFANFDSVYFRFDLTLFTLRLLNFVIDIPS